MESICLWNEARKHKKKAKEKEAKEKRKSVINQKISEEKLKKKEEEMNKVENFVDENIQEAFETLKIYQKCLEDEKKKWLRLKKNMTANNTASVVKNLRKVRPLINCSNFLSPRIGTPTGTVSVPVLPKVNQDKDLDFYFKNSSDQNYN
jgi:hypothetical protein